eukprot:365126-Chlamydomonas_euryale.AAC.38
MTHVAFLLPANALCTHPSSHTTSNMYSSLSAAVIGAVPQSTCRGADGSTMAFAGPFWREGHVKTERHVRRRAAKTDEAYAEEAVEDSKQQGQGPR